MTITFSKSTLKRIAVTSAAILLTFTSLIIYSMNTPAKQELVKESLHMAAVDLKVRNLEPMVKFYKDLVGLNEISKTDSSVELGSDKEVLIRLFQNKDLDFVPQTEAGLYHSALVFPTQAKLAKTIKTIFESRPELYQGSADHVVTEAFYFGDPEGNGVELYFDKPRTNWQYDSDGKPVMGSVYIDEVQYIEKYASHEINEEPIRMGHVHLKVGDIGTAKKFYIDVLKFDLITQMANSALFISKDNYHHHLGMNVWQSMGAGTRKSVFTGLKSFEIKYHDKNLFEEILRNLEENNIKVEILDDLRVKTFDPWNNEINLLLV